MMLKEKSFLLVPIILGSIGGLILAFEMNTYISGTSRLRILFYHSLAYFIALFLTSILAQCILIVSSYRYRIYLGICSLTFLTIINELNFWTQEISIKDWAANPKNMFIATFVQLFFGILLVFVVNVRPQNGK